MAKRSDIKPGNVISFRIPENISKEDLEHLRNISKRDTPGKPGAISDFFFKKVTEDRIQEGKCVSIALPRLTAPEMDQLQNPVVRQAIALYIYQLLNKSDVVTMVDSLPKVVEATPTQNTNEPVDKRAIDLLNNLRG